MRFSGWCAVPSPRKNKQEESLPVTPIGYQKRAVALTHTLFREYLLLSPCSKNHDKQNNETMMAVLAANVYPVGASEGCIGLMFVKDLMSIEI